MKKIYQRPMLTLVTVSTEQIIADSIENGGRSSSNGVTSADVKERRPASRDVWNDQW